MGRWRNVLPIVVLCVGVFLVCVPQVSASASSPYWQIDENVRTSPQNPNGTDIWFAVTNNHASDSLAGFAVTMDNQAAWNVYDRATANAWSGEIIPRNEWNLDSWSYMTTSSDPTVHRSAEWFFGGTWENLFGNDESSDFAVIFWSHQNVTPPNNIPAGEYWEYWGDSSDDPIFSYTFGDEGGPLSTAAIRMQSGITTHGAVNTPHNFPTGGQVVIPEPATLTLFGLGLIGAALRRRRK